MSTCSYCGHIEESGSVFCACCGLKLSFIYNQEKDLPPAPFVPTLVDFTKTENPFSFEDGFSRPLWSNIAKYIEAHVPPEELNHAWTEAARQWLEQTKSDLGGNYRIFESENFFLLSSLFNPAAKDLLKFSEAALGSIKKHLHGTAHDEGYGKQVILLFDEFDDYYQYISHFYPEGHHASTSGIFIGAEYGHVAAPFSGINNTQHVIVHELTHSCLRHLPLPTWLNEGLSLNLERLVQGGNRPVLDSELAERHYACWNENNIQGFWSGTSFYDPEAAELSYSLAEILVQILAKERESFLAFVNHAHYSDAGHNAAFDFFGFGLGDPLAGFLGEGDWNPNRKAIADHFKRKNKPSK